MECRAGGVGISRLHLNLDRLIDPLAMGNLSDAIPIDNHSHSVLSFAS